MDNVLLMRLTILNLEDAYRILNRAEEEFRLLFKPHFVTQLQLYLTGNAFKGIEIFSIGPLEIRGLMHLVEYSEIVLFAKHNDYRVFVKREGKIFNKGEWSFEFKRK